MAAPESPGATASGTQEPASDAEAGKDRRSEDGEDPWVGRLRRRQERLEAALQELPDQAGQRWQEDDRRGDAEPGDRAEGEAAARGRGPLHGGGGDREGCQRGEAHQEVRGPARPVPRQEQHGDGCPQAGEAHGKEAELEQANAHDAQSSGGSGVARGRAR